MPPATTVAAEPIKVASPPSVPPNIMAMKTGRVAAGQAVKSGAMAASGTISVSTR